MEETCPPAPASSAAVTRERPKRSKTPAANKRKLDSSSSSESTRSSSPESSSLSSEDEKRRRRRKHNKRRRRSHHTRKLNQLIEAVGVLQNKMSSTQGHNNQDSVNDDVIDPNVSGELFDEDTRSVNDEQTDREGAIGTPALNVVMHTKVKEPTIPQAPDDMLQQLKDLQRFDRPDWNSVRYVEVQKQYLRSPGFTNLDPNDEVRRYDHSKFTSNMESAFAGLTFALLKQREILQEEMNNFLIWAQLNDADLSYTNIHAKISEIFSQGEYSKVASDIIQMVCGHRAELVQHRREGILAAIKDPYHKSTLRKIPPSCSTLFQKDQFNAVLDKAGGVNKIFWAKGKDRNNTAPQYDPGTSSKSQNYFVGRQNTHSKHNTHPHTRKQGNNWDSFRGRGKQTGGRGQPVSRRPARTNSPASRRDRRDHGKRRY